jgi:chromosome partitioning protein
MQNRQTPCNSLFDQKKGLEQPQIGVYSSVQISHNYKSHTTMAEPNALRILVVNGKGGCGKTTIATNLAAAYARLGHTVALTDHDAQASSTQWLEQRAAPLPVIHLIAAHQRTPMYTTRSYQQRVPPDTTRIIIDTPSAVSDKDLETLLRGIDAILVPVLPSSIDIRAGARFIAQLLSHRVYRTRPVPVGVIANRVRDNTLTHAKLIHFLQCLNVPTVATFRDSALYTRLAEDGSGIFDDEERATTAREVREWCNLLQWLDTATAQGGRADAPQLGPRAAPPHNRTAESAEA